MSERTGEKPLQRKALVVDDHAATRRAHRRVAMFCDLRVETAADGLEATAIALDALERGDPHDLILMDLEMPFVDGWSAAVTLRENGYAGTIIAISGLADQDLRERCLTGGFDAFIAKPAAVDDLIRTIGRLMSAPPLACNKVTPVTA